MVECKWRCEVTMTKTTYIPLLPGNRYINSSSYEVEDTASRFIFTSSRWDGTVEIYLEAGLDYKIYASLFKVSDNSQVASSEILGSSSRIRSSNCYADLVDGEEYEVRNKFGSSAQRCYGARLVIVQTNPTKTESYLTLSAIPGSGGSEHWIDKGLPFIYNAKDWSRVQEVRLETTARGGGQIQLYNLTDDEAVDNSQIISDVSRSRKQTIITLKDGKEYVLQAKEYDDKYVTYCSANLVFYQTSVLNFVTRINSITDIAWLSNTSYTTLSSKYVPFQWLDANFDGFTISNRKYHTFLKGSYLLPRIDSCLYNETDGNVVTNSEKGTNRAGPVWLTADIASGLTDNKEYNARIKSPSGDNVNIYADFYEFKVRVGTEIEQTLTAKGNIRGLQQISAKGRIGLTTITIESKARIQKTQIKTITVKASISWGETSITTISANTIIRKTFIKTLTAKASINRRIKTIQAKAYILNNRETIQAKAYILELFWQKPEAAALITLEQFNTQHPVNLIAEFEQGGTPIYSKNAVKSKNGTIIVAYVKKYLDGGISFKYSRPPYTSWSTETIIDDSRDHDALPSGVYSTDLEIKTDSQDNIHIVYDGQYYRKLTYQTKTGTWIVGDEIDIAPVTLDSGGLYYPISSALCIDSNDRVYVMLGWTTDGTVQQEALGSVYLDSPHTTRVIDSTKVDYYHNDRGPGGHANCFFADSNNNIHFYNAWGYDPIASLCHWKRTASTGIWETRQTILESLGSGEMWEPDAAVVTNDGHVHLMITYGGSNFWYIEGTDPDTFDAESVIPVDMATPFNIKNHSAITPDGNEIYVFSSAYTGYGPAINTHFIQRNRTATGSWPGVRRELLPSRFLLFNNITLYSSEAIKKYFNATGLSYVSEGLKHPYTTRTFNAVGDILYLGKNEQFDTLTWGRLNYSVGYSITTIWEYWNGTTWQEFTPSEAVDWITYSNHAYKFFDSFPANWTKTSINNGPSLYYVRARTTTITGYLTIKNILPKYMKARFVSTVGYESATKDKPQATIFWEEIKDNGVIKNRLWFNLLDGTSFQTITSKASISTGIETRTQTINAKLDIAIWSKRSDIWQFEITAQYTRTKTIQSKASIKKEYERTVQSKGDISKQFTQTIDVLSRIQLTIERTINAKGRIQTVGTGATINAKTNIKRNQQSTIVAKSAIQKTFTQTIESIGRIQKSPSRTIETKANIVSTLIRTIQSLGRITITSEQIITSKGRIDITTQQTIISKARVCKGFEQTINTKARITQIYIQTISVKGRVTVSKSRTISSIGRIARIFTQTLTSLSRIEKQEIKTIDSNARIQIKTTQSIQSLGRITVSTEKTISSISRIQKSFNQSVITIGRITKQSIQTIFAKSAISKTFNQTVGAKGRIKITSQQTIYDKGRITSFSTQEIQSKASIQKTFSQTLTSKSRIEKQFEQTLSTKANITSAQPKTVLAKANIRNQRLGQFTVSVRINSTSDEAMQMTSTAGLYLDSSSISVGSNTVLTGYFHGGVIFRNVNITKNIAISGALISAILRLEGYNTNLDDGKDMTIYGIDQDDAATFAVGANDIVSRPKTDDSIFWDCPPKKSGTWYDTPDIKAALSEIIQRASWTTNNAIGFLLWSELVADNKTSKFSAYKRATIGEHAPYLIITYVDYDPPTITAKASIKKLLSQSVTTKARIAIVSTQNTESKSNIQSTISRTVTAKGRIGIAGNAQSITSKARIQKQIFQTVQSNGDIKKQSIQTISTKSSIKKSFTQLIQTKAVIQKSFTQTITASGRIQLSKTQTIQSIGRIKKEFIQLITSKGRIEKGFVQTVDVKGRIEISNEQSVTAKGNIVNTLIKTIQAKARILIKSTRTLTAKGRISISTSETINSKGDIKKVISQNIQAKASIGKIFTQSISTKARIQTITEQTIIGKGRITISQSQTIQSKSRILRIFSQTINAKGRITIFSIQTINSKSSIFKSATKTIQSKASIFKSFTQTIQSKSRIQKQSIQTINAVANIKETIIRTILTKGRIQLFEGASIDAKGNIKTTIEQTIQSKSAIQRTFVQTIDALGRIAIIGNQTIDSKARIEKESSRTIIAKARIYNTYQSIISARGNIRNNLIQTVSALGRIKISSTQSIRAKAAIHRTFIQTATSIGRIQNVYQSTINAKGNIVTTQIRTIQSKGRIGIYGIGTTIDAKASIKKESQQTITVLSSIKKQSNRTISGLGRIAITSTRLLTSNGNIKSIITQTINTRGRITNTYIQTVFVKSAIQKTFDQTLQSKAIIGIISEQTIEAKASIREITTRTVQSKGIIGIAKGQTIDVKGDIKKTIERQINAKGRIGILSTYQISAKGRIGHIREATIDVKGRITISSNQSINALGRIGLINIQTTSAKGRIQKAGSQTINTKGRIEISSTQTINANGDIKKIFEQNITAKADIKKTTGELIDVKSRITITSQQNIEAKARITITSLQTIEAQGDIEKITTQNITAKARIRIFGVTQTIQAKGIVLRLFTRTISAKGRIVTWRVVDIIDKVRDQRLVKELTYVKEITREITYNKVTVVNILEPSRRNRIKWITVNAKIKH